MIRFKELKELGIPECPLTVDVASLREDIGISQGALACVLNVSRSSVVKWESGTRQPSGSVLRLLELVMRKGIDILL